MSLTEREWLDLIENALAQIQGRDIPYIGLCVNVRCGTALSKNHPHWDDEHVALAESITNSRALG